MTPQVVLTTLKCFIRVKDVREYYEIPQKSKTIRGKVIYNHDLDPAEIIIAQVLIAKRDKVKFPLETIFENRTHVKSTFPVLHRKNTLNIISRG